MRLNTETSKELRTPTMKPPKQITLIDLEGNPIPLRENVPLHCLTREYAHIVDFIWQFEETDYRIYIGASYRVGEATKHYEELLPLLLFLQDQLTFIRNGMWETLAIYQTTLGKYWEVPWYNLQDLLDTGLVYECRPVVRHNARQHKQKVPVDYFIENYPDVFSKLTPWEGESTDATH